ncbi:MAG TPA: thioredoxin family protein [Casimicrobiaceae bacterium]
MTRVSVLILTQANCGYCDAAQTVLERLARRYPLTISTVSLETGEGEELARKGGILLPPGIFFDGEPFCYGRPSEPKLRAEIERRLAASTARSGASAAN